MTTKLQRLESHAIEIAKAIYPLPGSPQCRIISDIILRSVWYWRIDTSIQEYTDMLIYYDNADPVRSDIYNTGISSHGFYYEDFKLPQPPPPHNSELANKLKLKLLNATFACEHYAEMNPRVLDGIITTYADLMEELLTRT